MDFLRTLEQRPFMLYDGPMETRIEYDSALKVNKEISMYLKRYHALGKQALRMIFALIYMDPGRKALRKLYEGDIAVVENYLAPIILNAPTFRASLAHCQKIGYTTIEDVAMINSDCIAFVKEIRAEFENYVTNIYVTAPIGPMHTDYSPDFSMTIDGAVRYHSLQADAIAKANVDVISIATMLSAIETIGCAKAVAKTGLPYSVGILLNSDGTLVDGTPAKDLIKRIDDTVSPQPNFYIISCTHPETAAKALSDHDAAYRRILGIKANGSGRPETDLLAVDHPIADEPNLFADELIQLGKDHHFKIYGGCCGTDDSHLDALARKLTQIYE